MSDTITKILFRRGLDLIRRTGGGTGTVLYPAEPGYSLDTGRLYVGDGATIGGIPASMKNHGAVTQLFGSYHGYDPTTYSILTAGGVEVGDIVIDNSTATVFYVGSKNPVDALPQPNEWISFGLVGTTTAHSGISATQNGSGIDISLDPNVIAIDTSDNVTIPQTLTINGPLIAKSTLNINSNLIVGQNLFVTNNTNSNIFFASGAGPGHNSNDWATAYTNTVTLCANVVSLSAAIAAHGKYIFLDTPVIVAYSYQVPFGNAGYPGSFTDMSFPSANYVHAFYTAATTTPVSGTYNTFLSGGIPSNISALIIHATHFDSQNGGGPGYIYIATSQSTTQRLLIIGGQGGGSGAGIGNNQGIFPADALGNFYWNRAGSNMVGGWIIGIVGYIT